MSKKKSDSKKPDPKKRREHFLKDLEKKLYQETSSQKPSRPSGPRRSPFSRYGMVLILTVLLITMGMVFLGPAQAPKGELAPYSEFIKRVEQKEISDCTLIETEKGAYVEFHYRDVKYQTKVPSTHLNLVEFLLENEVHVNSEVRETNKYFLILLQWLPWILLMVFFWFLISRQIRSRMGNGMAFGKSKAKLVSKEQVKETFEDVQGCVEAKADLQDIVLFLKNPRKYTDIGARIPKGVLLVGPPGTGKTLLAKAVAGESKVPFLSMSGSDFVELFVGVGASRVRDLFETGKTNAPCIIFIDELDAVGRARGAGYGGGHDEREQTLNQMLVEMDGFGTDKGIIVLAATNRPDILDKALLRPGRFDRQVIVDLPDLKGRKDILGVHVKKIKLASEVDLSDIARGTPGFTGADLANLINEAALIAVKDGSKTVHAKHLERAKDKIMLGSERKSMLLSERERKNTAYHEAGHALVGIMVKEAPSLHKVSIIPRGRALGVTHFLPEDGVLTKTKSSLEAELRVLYGGRIAEEVALKNVTNGAMNDIERATKIARAMVCEWGLSKLGPVAYGEKEHPIFLAKEIHQSETISEETSRKIDNEIKRILDEAYKDAFQIIKNNLIKLKKLAETLLEKETMEVVEVYNLLKIKPPKKVLIT